LLEQTQSTRIPLLNAEEGLSLFGPQDSFLKLIERETEAKIGSREAEISIHGPAQAVEQMTQLFEVLLQLVRNGYVLTERDILYAIELAKELRADQLLDLYKGEITQTYRGKPIRVKTIGQKHYVLQRSKKAKPNELF
jgi:phosphate starvation-inducible PhoH-like protein